MPNVGSEIFIVRSWLEVNRRKKVVLFWEENSSIARVYSSTGELECTIPPYDISVPNEVRQNPQFLFFFAQDCYIRLRPYSDGNFGLEINPCLRGGGWWDGICSVLGIAGGVALCTTGPLGAVVGYGLVNAGINGLGQAVKSKQNFTRDYRRTVGAGFLTGVILGGARNLQGH